MFQLTAAELDCAFQAIEFHGYSGLLPAPPEWGVLKDNWPDIRAHLSSIDLDVYRPSQPLRVYAPKSRATVRVVSLLHPLDLVIYTALTLIVKNDIEVRRVSRRKRIVYSYRTEINKPDRLYGQTLSFVSFQERLRAKSLRQNVKYVGIADIADFYPRIYQHRLENVIESCASTQRGRDVARVLVKKLIFNLSSNTSYGIPVGPYASRILAEAVLIDIDSHLLSEQIDFVRWVDDYYFFTRSERETQEILIRLAARLYDRNGLTLSALKTKIQPIREFKRRFEDDDDEAEDDPIDAFKLFTSQIDFYSEAEIVFSEDEIEQLEHFDVTGLIEEALSDRDLVDYETLAILLRHPKIFTPLSRPSRKALSEVLLNNIHDLYPVAGEVARIFSTFVDDETRTRNRIKGKLLRSLYPRRGKWPPDYYLMWILSIFGESEVWRDAPDFVRILRDHPSPIVKRAAALSVAANGTRADAVEAKELIAGASKLERLAILLASRRLGADERRHWRNTLNLVCPLERLI